MTKAAQHFGKDVRKFWINVETQEYLDALKETAPKSEQFVQTTMGRNGGTWGHPKLASPREHSDSLLEAREPHSALARTP